MVPRETADVWDRCDENKLSVGFSRCAGALREFGAAVRVLAANGVDNGARPSESEIVRTEQTDQSDQYQINRDDEIE